MHLMTMCSSLLHASDDYVILSTHASDDHVILSTHHGRPQHFLKGGASRGRGAPIGKGRGEDNKFCWSIHISNITVQIITISRYRLYVYENIRLDRSIFLGWSVKKISTALSKLTS